MASLLPEILCDISQQAPPPCKDYYNLTVSKTEVVLRVWKVSNPNRHGGAHPTSDTRSHVDFLQDGLLQGRIKRVFGQSLVEYVLNLCQQHFDYLVRLSDDLIIGILSFLDWEDIRRVAQTCKKLQQVCSSEGFWARAATAPYGRGRAVMEGVSPAIQRRLLVFHRRQALSRAVQQQKKQHSAWHPQ
ncbi:hypothetical protein AAFF_G00278940 [Aldrovandia affinis]|uniref:F-box domain-containing protein n=1 Tax=Aldrovandia affinis TaxID=143900 RepID=A0AAD7SRK2_9TELE|nr:hypothetical protein AAFF_G00278940 [Aldrovandia affinis]